jgi:hypothetical protein
MELFVLFMVAAAVPTILELRRDGMHRLDGRDDWRGLRSHRPS